MKILIPSSELGLITYSKHYLWLGVLVTTTPNATIRHLTVGGLSELVTTSRTTEHGFSP